MTEFLTSDMGSDPMLLEVTVELWSWPEFPPVTLLGIDIPGSFPCMEFPELKDIMALC